MTRWSKGSIGCACSVSHRVRDDGKQLGSRGCDRLSIHCARRWVRAVVAETESCLDQSASREELFFLWGT